MSDASDATSPGLDPTAVFAAFSNAIRWRALQLMADGSQIRATDLAAAIQRDFDICSKHLTILANTGAVDWTRGQDRRTLLYFIPEQYRPQPGVVDYGFCAVRFGDAVKLAGKIPVAKD